MRRGIVIYRENLPKRTSSAVLEHSPRVPRRTARRHARTLSRWMAETLARTRVDRTDRPWAIHSHRDGDVFLVAPLGDIVSREWTDPEAWLPPALLPERCS